MKNNSNIPKSKIAYSFFWVLVERFGYSVINLLATIILARLLSPYEFGLIGTITIIVSISNMLIESGMGAALVNKKEITRKDCDTVFTFNLLMSIFFYITIFAFAPIIANYFEEPILKNVIRVLSLTLIFNAFTVIQRVILMRKMLFKSQSFISIVSLIVSVIIAIFAALSGWGVWAIVIQLVLYSFTSAVMTIGIIKYLPTIQFSIKSFKELLGFGGRIILSGVIQVSYSDLISSVISKVYTIQTTGLYTQSQKLISFPVFFFRSLFDGAAFPILSKAKDKREFKEMCTRINRGIYFLAFPMLIVIPFNTKEIIEIILGREWIEADKIFTILSIGVIISLIDAATFCTLKSAGESKTFLTLGTIKAIIGISVLSVTFLFPIEILLYGIIFTNLTTVAFAIYYVDQLTFYKVKHQLRDIVFPLMMSFVASGVSLVFFQIISFDNEIINLLVFTVLTILIFIVECLLFKIEEINFVLKKIKVRI